MCKTVSYALYMTFVLIVLLRASWNCNKTLKHLLIVTQLMRYTESLMVNKRPVSCCYTVYGHITQWLSGAVTLVA